MNVVALMNLKDNARFVALKPLLLKCTILAMENMGTNQKNDALTKGDFQTSASAENENPWRGYYILTWAEGIYTTGPIFRYLNAREIEPQESIRSQ